MEIEKSLKNAKQNDFSDNLMALADIVNSAK